MNEEKWYPDIRVRHIRGAAILRWASVALAVGFGVSALVNALVGGKAWCLFVLAGEYVFYKLFLSWHLVDLSFLQKWASVVMSVCVLLLVIERENGGSWASRVAVPMVVFGAAVVSFFVFLLYNRRERHNLLAVLQIDACAILAVILSAQEAGGMRWPAIVLASVSGGLTLLAALLFRKPILAELKKKLFL